MRRRKGEVIGQPHQSSKVLAARKGTGAELSAVTPEEDTAFQALRALLSERIARGLTGEVSENSFDEIVGNALGPDGAVPRPPAHLKPFASGQSALGP